MTPQSMRSGAVRALPLVLAVAACDRDTDPPLAPPSAATPAVSPAALSAQSKQFRAQVTMAGIQEHQAALQQIADANGDTRRTGTAGYDASAQYVSDRLTAAGYAVSFQDFAYDFTGDVSPPVLQQLSPAPTVYTPSVDFRTMNYSGSGDVTAVVTAVDVNVNPPGGATSGCEASDFAGFPAGNIALLQRGVCSYRIKVDNAINAGASGVIIFNEGNTPSRMGADGGNITAPQVDVPVVFTSFALGSSLVTSAPAPTVRIKVEFTVAQVTATNVIAETRGKAAGAVVVAGAPLEGNGGPGINAASGAAALLDIAEAFARHDQSARNKMRFIWFAGSSGDEGATSYLGSLPSAERNAISAMLEFPEIGSPNYVRFVYDGDGSDGGAAGPPGSGAVESLFADFLTGVGLAIEPVPFGATAVAVFANAGIPVGGLRSGTLEVKSPAQAATFGGTAGVQLDPCSGLPCDTFANTSTAILDQLAQGAAHAVFVLSRRNFQKDPLTP